MNLMPIEGATIAPIQMANNGVSDVGQQGPAFAQMLGTQVDQLDGSLKDADQAARALAAGDNIPVHDVMIAMEHARLKLQFAVEVRNRIIDAYQNLTNMQL